MKKTLVQPRWSSPANQTSWEKLSGVLPHLSSVKKGSGDWWCPCVFCLDEIPYCYSVSSSQQGHYLHQQSPGPWGALLSFVMSSLEFVVTQQSQTWLVSSQLVQNRDPWARLGQGQYCGASKPSFRRTLGKKNPTIVPAFDHFYQQQCNVGFFLKKAYCLASSCQNPLMSYWPPLITLACHGR